MKAYAIICEYGAGCIHEETHMVCTTKKIAQAWFDALDYTVRPVRIEEIEIEDTLPSKPKKKKKKKKKVK
jgi:hypothetical protein